MTCAVGLGGVAAHVSRGVRLLDSDTSLGAVFPQFDTTGDWFSSARRRWVEGGGQENSLEDPTIH